MVRLFPFSSRARGGDASHPLSCGRQRWNRRQWDCRKLVWSVLYALACLGWKCGPYLHFCPGQSGKCLGGIGVAGDLVLPDETLLEFQLSWMPWKMFNYSVPPAVNYCAHQHCMRCSPPWESGPHPYLPCRQVPPKPHLNTTEGQDIVNLEVASSHLPFDGLLLCFAGKNVNLTEDSVDLENITEGGTLYDSVGKEMFGRATTRVSDFLTPWTSAVSGDRYLDALEYGVLSDFLSNDEYYSSTFEYQRYDQFRSWKYTADIGAALVRDKSRGNNCMLMSGAGRWKQRTRYEITLRVSGPGNLNVSEAPIWLAPLKYDEYAGDLSTWPEITNAEDLKASTSVLFPTLSVRGPKEGAVCSIVRSWAAQSAAQESAFALAQHRADPAATAAQSLYVLNGTAHDRCSFSGQVTSPRTGECIRCPRLNDAARDGDCRLHLNATRGAVRWGTWTNDGLLSNNNIKLVSSLDSHDCCASNTYPQLIGDQACGGVISPNLADTDLNPANAHRLLTQRLCVRYGYIRRVWEKSFCALECLQDGDVDFRKKPFGNLAQETGRSDERALFGSKCQCNIHLMTNASRRFSDAYVAREMVKDFMYEAALLVDEYALAYTKRRVRMLGLDVDARRPESPTRVRGLSSIVVNEQPSLLKRGNSSFYDMYNRFVEFNRVRSGSSETRAVHSERGRVDDFDTQYNAELNLRHLGMMLHDKTVNAAPNTCPAVFDPTAANVTDGLMWGHRDPYWPRWGHPIGEF